MASPTLSAREAALLSQHETTIERGFSKFVDVGHALKTILDKELYRETHPTFDAYCRARWNMSKSYVFRLIAATEIATQIAATAQPPPQTESVARPLAQIDSPQARAKVWRDVRKAAGDAPITAQLVRQAVRQHEQPEPTERGKRWTKYKGGLREDGELTVLAAIRKAITDQKLKQSSVSQNARFCQTNLSEFLNGKRAIQHRTLDRLLMAVNLKLTRRG